jgi:hypothetical protein
MASETSMILIEYALVIWTLTLTLTSSDDSHPCIHLQSRRPCLPCLLYLPFLLFHPIPLRSLLVNVNVLYAAASETVLGVQTLAVAYTNQAVHLLCQNLVVEGLVGAGVENARNGV